jgi:O-antigen/teichoic acid export membrane protein
MSEISTEIPPNVDATPPGATHSPSVHRNFLVYICTQLLTWTVTFASISVIPRLLGESSSGKLVFAMTATMLPAGFLCLGIDQFLMKEIGRDADQSQRLAGGMIGLRLALIVPALLGSIIAGFVLHASRADWTLIAILGPSGAACMFTLGFRAVFTGHERARQVGASDLVATSSSLIAIPFLRYGPVALAVATTLTTMVNVAIQWRWLRKLTRMKPVFDLALWRYLIRSGLPFCVNTYLLAAYGFVGVYIVRQNLGDAGLGVTGQVSKLFGTFMFIPVAMTSALLPSLARMADRDMEAFNRTKLRVLSLLMVIGLPVVVLILVLSPELCHLLYSKHQFVDMPLALQIIAFGVIPLYIVSSMYQFLVAQGRTAVWSGFLASTVVIYAVTANLSIPWCHAHLNNGPAGASIATVVAEMSSAIAALVLMKARVFDRDFINRLCRVALCAGAMGAVMVGSLRMISAAVISESGVSIGLRLIVPGAAGLAVFACMAWSLRVMWPQDQEKLGELLTRGLARFRGSPRVPA